MPKRSNLSRSNLSSETGVSYSTKKAKHTNYVKFVKSFKRPSLTDSLGAVGPLYGSEKVLLNGKDGDFYQPVPQPTSVDDWLAHVNEEGQTYHQYRDECPWISGRKVKLWKSEFVSKGKSIRKRYPNGKIYILPIGFTNDMHQFDMNDLTKYTSMFLGIPVELLPPVTINMPSHKDDYALLDVTQLQDKSEGSNSTRRCSGRLQMKCKQVDFRMKDGHTQLNAASLIKILKTNIPKDAICLVGLTLEDLYEESPDLFVAGLAAGNSRVAVFSFARYDPGLEFSSEHWFQFKKRTEVSSEDSHMIFKHSCKLLVHEICHLLGLDHCIWFRCCMNGSGHVREDFSQPMFLCPVDLRKLQTLTDFNIEERYKQMLDFFEKRRYTEEAEWLKRRLKFINAPPSD